MRVGIITQARTGSSRLPGKVLLEAGGQSYLRTHLDRLSAAGTPVVVATTQSDADDPIAALAGQWGVHVFRGSEDDVLSRFVGAACEFELDVVVRVTSDCPLVDGAIIAEGVRRYRSESDADAYLSNTRRRTYPRGLDFEIFSTEWLQRAGSHAIDPLDREHVTPYLHRHMRTIDFQDSQDNSRYRLTLDEHRDHAALSRLLALGAHHLAYPDLLELLHASPTIVDLNAGVQQKVVGDGTSG